MVFHVKCKWQLLFENEINCFLTADHQNLKVWKFQKTQFLKNPNRKLKPQNLILKSFKNKELSFEWRMSTYIQEALHIHVHTSKATLNCATAESIRFMDIAYKPWKKKVTWL